MTRPVPPRLRPHRARHRRKGPGALHRLAVVTSIAVVVTVGAAYATELDAPAAASAASTVRIGDTSPGSIVSTSALPLLAPGLRAVSAQAVRMVYRSIDAGTGRLTDVSGAAFLPNGLVPPGGWPVVAVGHEDSGIDADCAPSLSGTLLGEAPQVAAMLKRGFAVAVTDYQGLGTSGAVHGYLDAVTAARNVIDSVRAVRGLFPGVSARWAGLGTAQGGAAVWAADQRARTYAPDLDLVGVAAVAPITDVSGLVDAALDGTLTPAQRVTLTWSLAALHRRDASLNLDDYRHGSAATQWDALTACSGRLVLEGAADAKRLDPGDLAPSSPEAADALRERLRSLAVGRGGLAAPLLVTVDVNDPVVDPRWTTTAIGWGCSAGATIAWHSGDVSTRRGDMDAAQLDWIADRFAGLPVENDCARSAVSSAGAGTVISTQDAPDVVAGLPPGARAARVVYRSTNGDTGAPTTVSGTVFAPPGPPPPGGWPVIAYGHPTTGIEQECAPSAPSVFGPFLLQVPVMAGLLRFGYAVAFTDYEGLGQPGVHPYLDARTAGLNVIDSVRALRATFGDVSPRWAGLGGSQGGAAVWAADEQAGSYAPELELVGVVSISPAADVTGLVDGVVDGTITHDQVPALQSVLASMGRLRPDFDLDSFRRGSAQANWPVLNSCAAEHFDARVAAMAELQAGDIAPATPQAADELRAALQRWALPQRRAWAPLSVLYGTADTYVDARWTTAAIDRACRLGDVISVDLQQGRGHSDVDWTSQLQWLRDRFRGAPADDECAGR